MTVYRQTDAQGIVRHYIQELESWAGFTLIIDKVVNSLVATVLECGDGPDSRYCILDIDGSQVVFAHDDMLGNCFFGQNRNATLALKKVEELFSDVP